MEPPETLLRVKTAASPSAAGIQLSHAEMPVWLLGWHAGHAVE